MDTTSTDLISYLLCRGSASSFGLPLFIILKKKLRQKKIKARSFRVPSTLTKVKKFISKPENTTQLSGKLYHMLRCHLAESQFVKCTKQTNKILRNHNLSARQKGYQINRSQTKLVQLLFPSNHSNKTAWCSHSSRKSNIYYILLP